MIYKEEPFHYYELMICSAVRYALPRHSYMVGVTQDYIVNEWAKLSKMHWCILRDIKEHIEEYFEYGYNPKENKNIDWDIQSWIITYNRLIKHNDTFLDDNWKSILTKEIEIPQTE